LWNTLNSVLRVYRHCSCIRRNKYNKDKVKKYIYKPRHSIKAVSVGTIPKTAIVTEFGQILFRHFPVFK